MSAGICIPQTDSPVPTPTRQGLTSGTERDALDQTRMSREGADMSAGLRIPQTDSVIRIITPRPTTCTRQPCFPSGLNDTLLTERVCPVRVRICLPVCVSHRRIVLSESSLQGPPLALASMFPSRLNGHAIDRIPMPSYECSDMSAGVNIPQTNGIVPTSTCQYLTIR